MNPNPSDIGCFASSSKKSWSLISIEVLRLLQFNDMFVLSNGLKQSGSFCYEKARNKIKNGSSNVMIGLNTYIDT